MKSRKSSLRDLPGGWWRVSAIDLIALSLLLFAMDDSQTKTQAFCIRIGFFGNAGITSHNH